MIRRPLNTIAILRQETVAADGRWCIWDTSWSAFWSAGANALREQVRASQGPDIPHAVPDILENKRQQHLRWILIYAQGLKDADVQALKESA